ncbi:hypothetical protein [Paraburkholderia sp. DGU8]|uniref:hypothetical protein n=1 Tax=Paraburkholderia sp. DGU8 TaxID=3161997 RepID=UPI003467C0F2
MELLVDTSEDYQQANECGLELFQAFALDAKNAYQGRMTTDQAIRLLTEARQRPFPLPTDDEPQPAASTGKARAIEPFSIV